MFCKIKCDIQQFITVTFVTSQTVTLVLLEVNLCLVTTVLFQKIPTVKFGFRTSGDYILLEYVLRDVETKLSVST